MSSAAEIKSTPTADSLRRRHWNLIFGLYWAAFLLLLLALWIYSKYWESGPAYMAWPVAGLFVIALGGAVWQTLQMRTLKTQKLEQQEKQLPQKRAQISRLFLILSGLLLVTMLVLLFQVATRLQAFPEVSSGVLLALIGLLTSFLVSGEEKKFNQQHFLESLLQSRKQLMAASLIIGGFFFVAGILLFYNYRAVWFNVFPQAAGAVLLGLNFLGLGMWLRMNGSKELTVGNMRVLVLVAGGTAGFVIALMTAIRALLWRDVVFAGGMSGWQGEQSWQLWLVIWLELVGLGLMFGSLYLAQADIRFNPTLRRLLYGYNAVFTGLLVMAALIALNVIVYASLPYTFNWTKDQGFYSLSQKSKGILRKLDKPTTVYVLLASKSEIYTDVKNLLENCQAYTNRLKVVEISPDKDQDEYAQLSKRFPKLKEAGQSFHGGSTGRGLLIAFGGEEDEDKAPPHSFIAEDEMAKVSGKGMMGEDGQPGQKYEFRGESMVMTQLSFLIGGETKPAIYFTQSNKEVDIKNKGNIKEAGSMLADKLEAANYQVRQLFWGIAKGKAGESVAYSQKSAKDPHKVPSEAKVVVIAWPKDPFTKEVLEALEEYMKGGGKLVVLSSPANATQGPLKTNLEGFMKKYGVDFPDSFAVHLGWSIKTNPYLVVGEAVPKSDNPIARAFRVEFVMEAPRNVEPLSGAGGSYKAETIFSVQKRLGEVAWVETDVKKLDTLTQYIFNLQKANKLWEKDNPKPISVAVAVTGPDNNPRLVVFGDGRMASNSPTQGGSPYHDLIVSSVAWLGDRPEEIGIPPKTTGFYALPVRDPKFSRQRLILLPLGLMLIGFVGIGMGVWVVRRP